MNKELRSIIIKVFFIIVLLVALWGVVVWDNTVKTRQAEKPFDQVVVEDNYSPDTILARRSFSQGTHNVEGTMSLPTPCHKLDVNAVVAESFPEMVTLDFTISQPGSDVSCIQVIEDRQFKVEFAASENASIKAKVNGQPAELIFQP